MSLRQLDSLLQGASLFLGKHPNSRTPIMYFRMYEPEAVAAGLMATALISSPELRTLRCFQEIYTPATLGAVVPPVTAKLQHVSSRKGCSNGFQVQGESYYFHFVY